MPKRKPSRAADKLRPIVGDHRPHILDVMVSMFMDEQPHKWTSRDAAEAIRDCGIADAGSQLNFKRGYVAGFLASIGIDRRTMKFTCDACHKRKSAGKRSANTPEQARAGSASPGSSGCAGGAE